jgi:catechol 2,3-dioxygenase-like lactoylglutathione lyase family enzyme
VVVPPCPIAVLARYRYGTCPWNRRVLHAGRRPCGPERVVSRLPRPGRHEKGVWCQGAGLTVFAAFESETDYFGSRAQQTMLNFRVRDLDAMLAQLRANGADVAKEVQEMEGVGRFGWVTDPEGNRVELWQPA